MISSLWTKSSHSLQSWLLRTNHNSQSNHRHDPDKVKGLWEVGKQLCRRTTGAGRASITQLWHVSLPEGSYFHQIFSLNLQTVQQGKSGSLRRAIRETTYNASESGWVTSETFLHFLSIIFLKQAPADRPLLVIFDGNLSNVAINVVKFALENQIVLIKLPAHTTDQMQPLDKVIFRPLKEK